MRINSQQSLEDSRELLMELRKKFNKTQNSKRSRKTTQKLQRKPRRELLKSPTRLPELQEKSETTLNKSKLASLRLKVL